MNKKMKISKAKTLLEVKPSGIRKLFTIANEMRQQGKTVLDFGLGDVDMGLNRIIRDAIVKAIDSGLTRYGPDPGEKILREAVANRYTNKYSANIDYNNVLITCGALESLLDTLIAYTNPGDEILLQEPSFGNFTYQIILIGGKPVPLITPPENYFKLTAEMVNESISPKTKALILNYPTNPTGMIIDKKETKGIVEVCEDAGILLISDESYDSLYYNNIKHTSAIEFGYEGTVVISSVSKSLCMTGMRVGFTVGSSNDTMQPIFQVHQYNTVHATRPIQYGAAAGLEQEEKIVKHNIDILTSRRKKILETWTKIPGLKLFEPQAAFYIYPDVTETGMDATEFCQFALEHGIVLVPGTAFGRTNSSGITHHFRMSFGIGSEKIIEDAANILINNLAQE